MVRVVGVAALRQLAAASICVTWAGGQVHVRFYAASAEWGRLGEDIVLMGSPDFVCWNTRCLPIRTTFADIDGTSRCADVAGLPPRTI